MKAKYFKALLLFVVLSLCLSFAAVAADGQGAVSVDEVTAMLEDIDTLQQMQNKRSSYTASGHYDINTTDTKVITRHTTAREKYESYLADMFEKRAEAQRAYDSLNEEQKAQIDSSLTAKLSNELPTTFMTGEFDVTPRDDEFSFEAVKIGTGFGYEVSNYMVSGEIPQTFIIVDTSDGKTTWTPDGEYVCTESNYEVAYCCDVLTPIAYGTYYKRLNLEDSNYFDAEESRHIRGILENSYPFVTMDEMKENLKKTGLSADFVDSITRADMISAVQAAVWSYANVKDEDVGELEYFASIDVPKNRNIYFNPLHDYTNEVWEWLPGKRTRSYDPRAGVRVNTLAEHLRGMEPVEAPYEQTVISDVQVVRTELVSFHDGIYDVTLYVTLNGGNEKDDLDIIATSYSENDNGAVNVTDTVTKKAVRDKDCYSIDISVKSGDTVRVEIDGKQYLPRGVYFYEPENGRDSSQSLVGVSEGYTHVRAEREIIFTAPEYTIVAPDEVEIIIGEKTVLKTEVIPEIGAPDVLYSSSDESVVRIDENGNIESVGIGTATITVYLEGNEEKKTTITVTVELPSYKIKVPEKLELTVGDTGHIDTEITPDDGRLKPLYSSSDESVVTVDSDGNIVGVSPGIARITIDFGYGFVRTVPVTVLAVPEFPTVTGTYYITFGKTDGIGWYEVYVNGGEPILQGPNSTLEVPAGATVSIRVREIMIGNAFDFYVNGSKIEPDSDNSATFVVTGPTLVGALSWPIEIPDAEESLNWFQKIIKAISNFFKWIGSWFK